MTKHSIRTKLPSTFGDEERLRDVVAKSQCLRDVIVSFFPNYSGKGSGHYRTLHKYLEHFGISTSHFTNVAMTRGLNKITTTPLAEILEGLHPHYSSGNLKTRALREGYLKNQCEECGGTDVWNGKPITIQLDHIDGNCRNHRLENLRMVCPNCHSQTITWSGRRLSRPKPPKVQKDRPNKINWPKKEVLHELVWSKPMTEIAKDLGVTDVAISKACGRMGVDRPPRGYWVRKS